MYHFDFYRINRLSEAVEIGLYDYLDSGCLCIMEWPENIEELLRLCRHYEVPVLLGTDSHICYTVGVFDETLEILKEMDFPEELVLNFDVKNIKRIKNPLKK